MHLPHENDPPPTSRAIVLALVALVVLTVISWAMAHVELGAFGTPVAIAIAAVKATVVEADERDKRNEPGGQVCAENKSHVLGCGHLVPNA